MNNNNTLKLAKIFTSNMVLQANKPIRIFGEGRGSVQVKIGKNIQSLTANGGEWCIELPKMAYGGPYDVEVLLNDEKTVLENVYIGEVWIAAGQSNMEMPIYRADGGFSDAELATSDKIHLFTVPRRVEKDTPQFGWHFEKTYSEDTPWQIADKESVLHFSAIGYYTAKFISQKIDAHIGVISCNWGGMPIEAFISRDYFENSAVLKESIDLFNSATESQDDEEYKDLFKNYLDDWKKYCEAIDYDEIEEAREKGLKATSGTPPMKMPDIAPGIYRNREPGVLYEAMFSRIVPFGCAGFLWYQGESNIYINYGEKYKVFMKCMRERFKDDTLPFYATELASFSEWWTPGRAQTSDDRFVEGINWAFFREEQYKVAAEEKNNYVVTSMELGDLHDVHPPQKRELARRMANKVLRYTYGLDIYADQPEFQSIEFDANRAIIRLKNSEGLYSKNIDGVKMYMADESRILKRAKLKIENDAIIAECDEVEKPILVRYAFDFYYQGCHIYNKAGLPVAPFRTDNL